MENLGNPDEFSGSNSEVESFLLKANHAENPQLLRPEQFRELG